MPWHPEETAAAARNYNTIFTIGCSHYERVELMGWNLKGVQRGGREKLPRAAIEGARTYKATRALWLIAPHLTIIVPLAQTSESQQIERVLSAIVHTLIHRVSSIRHVPFDQRLVTARSTKLSKVLTAIPVGPFDRYGLASSPQAVPAMSR